MVDTVGGGEPRLDRSGPNPGRNIAFRTQNTDGVGQILGREPAGHREPAGPRAQGGAVSSGMTVEGHHVGKPGEGVVRDQYGQAAVADQGRFERADREGDGQAEIANMVSYQDPRSVL